VPYTSFDILDEPGQGSIQTLLAVLSTCTDLRGNSSSQEETACGGGPFISGRGCPRGTVVRNGDHSFREEAEIDGPGGHFISKYTVRGDILFQNILSGGTVLGGTKFFVTVQQVSTACHDVVTICSLTTDSRDCWTCDSGHGKDFSRRVMRKFRTCAHWFQHHVITSLLHGH